MQSRRYYPTRENTVPLATAPTAAMLLPLAKAVARARSAPRRGTAAVARIVPPFVPTYTHINGTGIVGAGGTGNLEKTTTWSVAAGNLVIVGVTGTGTPPATVSDLSGNNYTGLPAAQYSTASFAKVFYSTITTGGALNITASSGSNLSMAIDEFSFSSNCLIAADGHNTGNASSGTAAASGTVTPTGSDLFYGLASFSGLYTTSTPGSGYTGTYSHIYNGGQPVQAEYQLNVSTAANATVGLSASSQWACAVAAFKAAVPAIFLTPAVVPANHAGGITIELIGSGTDWISGTTTFSLSGVPGVSQVGPPSIASQTAASIVLTTGSSTGTGTISDGVNTGTFTVTAPTIAVNPPGAAQNAAPTITVSGTNTLWLSEPSSPPLFSASGVSGVSISDIVVQSDNQATFTLTTGTPTGVVTVTDSSTTAAATVTVYTNVPGIAVSPAFIPVNQSQVVLALTGVDTDWLTGTTNFALSGVSGATLVSQSITSTTAATIVVSTELASGTATLTDGAYDCALAVVPGAVVSQAYISRNGQTAYFLTTGPANSYGTGIGLTLTNGGSGYTSIPSVAIVGVNGTGAAATAIVSGGSVTGFTVAPGSGYTSFTSVTITGGGGTGAAASGHLVTPAPGFSIVGTSIANGGSGYTAPTAAIGGGIALTLTNGGSGYTSAPTVTISGGGGSGASATATIASGIGLVLTGGGSGYTSAPTVTISGGGGTGASATATIASGAVTGLAAIAGSDYTSAPAVAFSGGGGSGAAATAYLPSGQVSGFIVAPGSGYTSNPTVTIAGGGGTMATATAAVTGGGGTGCMLGTPVLSGGEIVLVPVVWPGSGYTSAPTIVVTDSTGTGAAVTAVTGGQPVAITAVNANPTISVNGNPIQVPLYLGNAPITNCGSGYSTAPAVSFSGGSGSGLSATAAITTSEQIGLTLTNGGSGYVVPPTVTIAAPGSGTTAAATAFINSSGTVIGLVVTNPGAGYTSAPAVTIALPPSGTPATATASYAGGAVYAIAVTNAGWGYLAADTVTVTIAAPESGTTATAIPVLGPVWTSSAPVLGNSSGNDQVWPFVPYQMLCGSVASILVQTGGANYTSPVITATGGGGTGLVLGTPSIANGGIVDGVVTEVPVTIGGSGYTDGNRVGITDSTEDGSGFVGYYRVSGGAVVDPVAIESGGVNYSAGSLTPTLITSYGGGTGLVFGTPTVSNNVIVSIPVIDAGSGYTSPPTITITDGGSGAGATAIAIMSGPAANDTVTFSAPANWLTAGGAPSGSSPLAGSGGVPVPASSSAPMMNFAGQIEPMFGQAPRTMQMGSGVVGAPNGANQGRSTPQNWITGTAVPWNGAAAPTVTIAPAGGDTTGANAAAYAVVNSSGAIASIVVSCGGSAYTATPTVTIAAPPHGTTATATANDPTLTGGVITSIAVSGGGGSGYAGTAPGGRPIALNGALNAADASTGNVPTAWASISANYYNSSVANNFYDPDQSGTWTFIADETNPSEAMVVSLYEGRSLVALAAGYPTAGTTIGGVAVGRTWQWNVTRANAGVPSLDIALNVAGPSANYAAPWTLTNEYMTAPVRGTGLAQTPNRSVPSAPNPNFVSWLMTEGGKYPAMLRLSPFGNAQTLVQGDSNVVDASDLNPLDQFSFQGAGAVTAVCIQIAPYSVSSSPYVYTNQNYPGTSAVGGGPWPYAWSPANINWLGNTTKNGTAAAEIVTASPHGFKTGQIVTFSNPTIGFTGTLTSGSPTVTGIASTAGLIAGQVVTAAAGSTGIVAAGNTFPPSPPATSILTVNGSTEITLSQNATANGSQNLVAALASVTVDDSSNGTGTVIGTLGGYSGAVWVTGANSFVIGCNLPPLATSGTNGIANIDASNSGTVYNFTIATPIPTGGFGPPYEVLTALAAAVPGCGLHTFIPAMATDACVAQIAATIRDNLPLGRLVLPELTDEHWNTVYPHTNSMFLMANLCTAGIGQIGSYNSSGYFALRQSQVHDVFVTVFNAADVNGNTNRGNTIVRAFGGAWGSAGTVAGNMINFANAYNATAPANPVRIDTVMLAPYWNMQPDAPITAAAASTYSTFPGSIQYGSTSPWSMAMYADLLRHSMRYNTGSPAEAAANLAVMAPYQLAPGQTVRPGIMCYEGSVQYAVPPGVSNVDWVIRSQITYDLFYHPDFYDVNLAYYASLQQMGYTLLQANTLVYIIANGGAPNYITVKPGGINDNLGCAVWAYVIWEGQTWGHGDGTVDGNGQDTTNQFFNGTGVPHDVTNVSPKLQAWRDWVSAANAVPYVTPVIPATSGPPTRMRWFPALNRLNRGY